MNMFMKLEEYFVIHPENSKMAMEAMKAYEKGDYWWVGMWEAAVSEGFPSVASLGPRIAEARQRKEEKDRRKMEENKKAAKVAADEDEAAWAAMTEEERKRVLVQQIAVCYSNGD